MQNISPLLQQRILNQPTGNTAQTPSVDLSQKPDTVEISNTNTNTDTNAEADKKPNKKKILKYAAIALGLTAVAAGAAIVFKGRVKDVTSMQKTAENMADEANKMLSDAQELEKEAKALVDDVSKVAQEAQAKFEKMRDEVITLFNNGGKKDGVEAAKISSGDLYDYLEEIDSDGVLLRKSCFCEGELRRIEEMTEKGKNKYIIDNEGKLSKYMEGYEELSDGTEKVAKRISIDNGELSGYMEGCEILPDGTGKAIKEMGFDNGELSMYLEGCEHLPDGTEKVAKEMFFSDGKLWWYREGSEILPDKTRKVAKCFIKNENGEWVEIK